MTVLHVQDVSIRVSGVDGYDIVSGVDLSLERGDVLGVVGESGSGKTTLALALLGFARRGTEIRGVIDIDGTDMVAASDAERRAARSRVVSYVPQDPGTALNPALRIGDQLTEAFGPSRKLETRQRERVDELLDRVKLPTDVSFLRRYPHQLSGGQLQRIAIAMAMLHRPKLIVFDEPTTGLDVTTQGHVIETIQDLVANDGTAGIYVTHDLAVVGMIANRLAVMYSGLLVEEGPTDAVLQQAAHPYARGLVMATPNPSARQPVVGIAGAALAPRARGAGCPFAARCDRAIQACVDRLPEISWLDATRQVRCHRSTELVAAPLERPTTTVADALLEEGNKPLLLVAGLHASHGSTKVLENLDLKLQPGRCLALVGESGSGKTTLARCVSGLHPGGVEGYLELAGERLEWSTSSRSTEQLQMVQYVFQNAQAALNPRHTVGHSIAHPLRAFGLAGDARGRRRRVRELLERVSLPGSYEHRYPSQLSGGERQRVAVARALAAEPTLLICDEITSSLDVSIQASILELLAELRRDTSLTLLFITHHLGVVRAIADEIVVLERGTIVERGDTATVLAGPSHPYTAELLANTPKLAAAAS